MDGGARAYVQLHGVARAIAFLGLALAFAVWLLWVLLLTIVYAAFGVGHTQADYSTIAVTYVLDPVAFVAWISAVKRGQIGAYTAVLILTIAALNVFAHL